jgi:hypothetical protein
MAIFKRPPDLKPYEMTQALVNSILQSVVFFLAILLPVKLLGFSLLTTSTIPFFLVVCAIISWEIYAYATAGQALSNLEVVAVGVRGVLWYAAVLLFQSCILSTADIAFFVRLSTLAFVANVLGEVVDGYMGLD